MIATGFLVICSVLAGNVNATLTDIELDKLAAQQLQDPETTQNLEEYFQIEKHIVRMVYRKGLTLEDRKSKINQLIKERSERFGKLPFSGPLNLTQAVDAYLTMPRKAPIENNLIHLQETFETYKTSELELKAFTSAGRELGLRNLQRRAEGAWTQLFGLTLKSLSTKDRVGSVLVTGVVPNGPASQAGFRAQDHLRFIEKKRMTTATEVWRTFQDYQPGSQLLIKVLRGKGEMKLRLAVPHYEHLWRVPSP